eukprot:6299067-Pyramimonas_sp.AAC.1
MVAIASFRHSALWAAWARQSNSRSARSADSPATLRAHARRLTMHAHVVATCKYEPLGKGLERSNLKPK